LKGGGEDTAREIRKLAQIRQNLKGDLIIVGDFNMHFQEGNPEILGAIRSIDEENPYQVLIREEPTVTDIRAGSTLFYFYC
jgi:L-alanine-DL-glutamate epimerase-like enolase superfamily enzyme